MERITLRPYQEEARQAVFNEWNSDNRRTLLVLATGTGKTVIFSKIIEDCVKNGDKCLILAHRGELLEQAADKMRKLTGMGCALEKANSSCLDAENLWYPVVLGSVQTVQQPKRLERFSRDYFQTIVVDEAHHSLSEGYKRILDYFSDAKVLGVTATPDRGDRQSLGEIYQSIAYEYSLPRAIKDGYLCRIKAQTIPLELDMTQVKTQAGDYSLSSVGTALDPYLEQIATEMETYCKGRKTIVFLPLIATSQKFCTMLNEHGFRAVEVNGMSEDRAEILKDFQQGKYDVICNSMLLTEGFDEPSIDCVVCLRPTKIRSLYCLDEKTEVLTPDGWKTDVEIGELVAAFDIKTNEIKYVPALAKVRRKLDPDEYFVTLNGQNSNLRVTNTHRMIYDNKRRSGWKFCTAEYMANLKNGCFLPVCGDNDFPGVPLTDDELRFIGWVMTDGTISKHTNGIQISQQYHQPWLEEIQKCIDGCNFKHNRIDLHDENTGFKRTSHTVIWTISKGKPRGTDKDKRGWGDLEPYLSKDLSPALMDMTTQQFEVMLEAIHLADGNKHQPKCWTQRSYHISKGNKTFIERLQIMAIQRGYRASVSVYTKNRMNPLYTIHIKKQNFISVGDSHDRHALFVKEPHTDEQCWCVQNELGTLVTRREGKVTIMGNCQVIGRGTRLYPGKDHLLLLDFLWLSQKLELCRPADLIATKADVRERMIKNAEDGEAVDIEEAMEQAENDVMAEREEKLAKELEAMRKKKRALVDPLQYEMSIQDKDLSNYVPNIGWEMAPASEKQIKALEKYGIYAEAECAGKASLILDKLAKRRDAGMTTPKQIRLLERYGFVHVGEWQFTTAQTMISRIALNQWRVPKNIRPQEYYPAEVIINELQT